MKIYLVGVCELDGAGGIIGTHHVSSHASETPEGAKMAAINDTKCDWGMGDDDAELHVLFVMAPVGHEIEVIEYDERTS